MAKSYSFRTKGKNSYKEYQLMCKFVSRLLEVYPSIETESYIINDGKDLYQEYMIFKIPGHLSLMFEEDYIPSEKSYLIKYTVLEESPNSQAAELFHWVAKSLEGGLEKLFGLK